MKFVDEFFECIIKIQSHLEKIDKWYVNKRKYILNIYILTVFVGIFFCLINQFVIGEVIYFLGLLLTGIENIIGWKHSVRRWLKICIVYNFLFSVMLAYLINAKVKYFAFTPMFVLLYLFVWTFLSLVSDSKISLLVNEIISGLSAFLFTVGTYVIKISIEQYNLLSEVESLYKTTEMFEVALLNGDIRAWDAVWVWLLEEVNKIFGPMLPIIGITTFSMILVKIKIYWMQINHITEP